MIGQNNLIRNLAYLIENKTFPRFSILVGPEGSGKKELSKLISKMSGYTRAVYGISVDNIRQLISDAYKVTLPTIYVIADADSMSPAAKNALLKVTEETPQNAYFILTLTDLNNTLPTIKSRGTVFYMDPYDEYAIKFYYDTKYAKSEEECDIVTAICSTPGEVDKVVEMGTTEFYGYVEKVVDNIATVSGSNSFKIAQKIKMKETETDKYDIKLFLKAFMTICASRLRTDPLRYAEGIKITSKYLQELRITGINKASLFDMFILDIRKEWR